MVPDVGCAVPLWVHVHCLVVPFTDVADLALLEPVNGYPETLSPVKLKSVSSGADPLQLSCRFHVLLFVLKNSPCIVSVPFGDKNEPLDRDPNPDPNP